MIDATHQSSHASLLRNASASTARPTRHLDAIIVPAARPSLHRAIKLSAQTSVPLVLLCSHQAQVDRVARRVEATFGARALVVEIPDGHKIEDFHQETSDQRFRDLSGGRSSNLSLKRNLGVLLARMNGWRKILFMDDDIYGMGPQAVELLAGQLDHHPVAGMRSWRFPDNSVVCHARRCAGLSQGVFVTGAVLGVDVQHPDTSFFPDVYNEDWLFFARHAANRSLPTVGEVRQDDFDPFADPKRAGREEFGDLIAEGLYALFQATPRWDYPEKLIAAASTRYWELFKEDRGSMIERISGRLAKSVVDEAVPAQTVYRALESLRHAEKQLPAISPDLCVDFIESWRDDDERWQRLIQRARARMSEVQALDELGLSNWVRCGYGRRTVSSPGLVVEPQPEPDLAPAV